MWRTIFSIPNLVSFLRLPFALLVISDIGLPAKYACLVLGILTDFLDGILARKLNQASRLGAFLDPLFDRLFALIIFVYYFITLKLAPLFIVFFFMRDLCTALASVIILILGLQSRIEIKARLSGKVVTAAQFLVLLALISQNMSLIIPGFWAVMILSVFSLADYLIYVIRSMNARKEG